MSKQSTEDELITVYVWEGRRTDDYEEMVEDDPDVYELPASDLDFGLTDALSDDEKAVLADNIDNHRKYAFEIPEDSRPATLNVHTNDSYHDPSDWGDPVERGLTYTPGRDCDPFKVELWGRVMMWVEVDDE